VVGGLLVLGGLGLAVVGVLGWRRRLPRNRWAGVRTVHTLRDEETFAVGNQVGAPLTMAAAAVAVLGGVAALAQHTSGAPARVTLVVLAGVGALALTVAGGVLGDRVARRVPVPSFEGCTGTCAGCSLVDGCSDSSAGATDSEVSSPPVSEVSSPPVS